MIPKITEDAAWYRLIWGVMLGCAFAIDFIPGLWRAADKQFSNGQLASLDGSSALAFTLCAIYIVVRMILDAAMTIAWHRWWRVKEGGSARRIDYF